MQKYYISEIWVAVALKDLDQMTENRKLNFQSFWILICATAEIFFGETLMYIKIRKQVWRYI